MQTLSPSYSEYEKWQINLWKRKTYLIESFLSDLSIQSQTMFLEFPRSKTLTKMICHLLSQSQELSVNLVQSLGKKMKIYACHSKQIRHKKCTQFFHCFSCSLTGWGVGLIVTLWGAAWNFGKNSPNLVSIPEYVETASRRPPIWSGCLETSGFWGTSSVFGVLLKNTML